MSTENETMGELVADMKDGKPVTWAQVNSAWTAEREALLKRARDNYEAGFAKGKEAADACLKPDPRWKERCEKCFENNACEPPECRYFDGEDCQSPIPNQHPMAQPGNVAALREALIKARAAICHHARYQCQSLSWENSNVQANCGDVLCSWRGLCEAKTAINAALSAPPRNCDVGTAEEQVLRWRGFCACEKGGVCDGCPCLKNSKGVEDCYAKWAQMPYEAEEGGAK